MSARRPASMSGWSTCRTKSSAARERIDHNLARQVARGKLSEVDMTAALSRISTGTDYAALGDCDLVIEAATENEEIKREIFKRLVPHLGPDALVATNTSSISITRLAATTDRPARFVALHQPDERRRGKEGVKTCIPRG